MKWVNLPAAEWLPDQPDLNNPGLILAQNCIPGATSYLPLSGTVAYSISISPSSDDYVRGGHSIKDKSGDVHIFAGDASRLLELSVTSWADISKSGGYSGTGGEEIWRFADWGNTVIATNFNNNPQQKELSAGVSFSDMAGSPPRSKYVAIVRDFVVFGSHPSEPNKVTWSAFNNANNYVPDVGTQSDFQNLQDGGPITEIVGGEFGVIFQEEAITLMQYEGPPRIFSFSQIEKNRGCRIPGTILKYGKEIYYVGDDDIFVIRDGQSVPLGAQKWARYFNNDVNKSYLNRVTTAIDPKRNIIIWSYPSITSTGSANKVLIYNWAVNRASIADIVASPLIQWLTPDATLEGLDVYGVLDSLTFSLDSPYWRGGYPAVAGFDANGAVFVFDGEPLTASIVTTEFTAPGRHTEITNIRPLVEGGSATVQMSTRALQNESASFGSEIATNASGECNTRVNGRFVRVKVNARGKWTHLQGAEIYTRPSSTR